MRQNWACVSECTRRLMLVRTEVAFHCARPPEYQRYMTTTGTHPVMSFMYRWQSRAGMRSACTRSTSVKASLSSSGTALELCRSPTAIPRCCASLQRASQALFRAMPVRTSGGHPPPEVKQQHTACIPSVLVFERRLIAHPPLPADRVP